MSGIQHKAIFITIAITFLGYAHATERCSDISPEFKQAGFTANNAFTDLVNFTMKNPGVDKTPSESMRAQLSDLYNVNLMDTGVIQVILAAPLCDAAVKLFRYMTTYNESLTEFVEATFTHCWPNQTITVENYIDYLKVVEFSLSNITALTDLEKNGAFNCISLQKPNIDNCLVLGHVYQNITSHNNYSQLFAKSHLTFNSLACDRTRNVEVCVLNVLKKDSECDKATEFVKRLFDFVISNFCKNETITESNNASVIITGHWSFFIMVSLWSALAFNRS